MYFANMENQPSKTKNPGRRRVVILPRSANWVDYKLPLEIHDMIAGFLSTRDLSALSRTSRYHRNSTEPTLYKEICWNPRDVEIFWPQYHWAPVHLLLRTLLSRPELASYIRGFAISCRKPGNGASHSIVWRCGEPEYTTDDMIRATALIKSLNLHKEKKWVADLKRGEVDLFLGLLFSAFTNLRRFHLSIDYQQICKVYFGEMLERLVAKSSLCALETLEYGGRGTLCESLHDQLDELQFQSAIDMRQVGLLFSIPSLRRISMSLPDNLFRPSSSLAGLSSLDLHHSTISPNGLGRILLATPCLKSLRYDAWIDVSVSPPDTRSWYEFLDCAELGRELAQVKFTLEQLYISIHFFRTPELPALSEMRFHFATRNKFRGTGGKVGTLREFTKLTSLTMPTTLVADWTPIRVSYRRVEYLLPEIASLLPVNTLDHLLLSDDPSLYQVVQAGIDYSEGLEL